MKKKQMTLKKKGAGGTTFTNYGQEGFDCIVVLSDHAISKYYWEIIYSDDKEKWGDKYGFKAAHSGKTKYNTMQECIPEIEQKILEITGESIQISLEGEAETLSER